METIKFTAEQKDLIVEAVETYFEAELQQEITQFEAEFLIDFFSEKIGNYYYNKGLEDAQAAIHLKMEDIVYELEKPTDFIKS